MSLRYQNISKKLHQYSTGVNDVTVCAIKEKGYIRSCMQF